MTEVQVPEEYAGNDELRMAFLAMNPGGAPPVNPPENPPANPPSGDPPGNPPVDPPPGNPPAVDETKYVPIEKHREISQSYEALQKELESIKSKQIIDVDPTVYRLSHMKTAKPELYPFYASMHLGGEVKPVDILVEDYVAENPEYKEKKAQVAKMFLKQYGLDKNIPEPLKAEDGHSDEEIEARNSEIEQANSDREIQMMLLEGAAKKVRSKLSEEFDKIELPAKPRTKEELQAETASLQTKWQPVVAKVFESLKAIPIFGPAKEGEQQTPFVEIEITDELKKKYTEEMMSYLSTPGTAVDENSLKAAYSMVHTNFIMSNMPAIIQKVADKARKLTEQEYDAMYSSASAFEQDKSKRRPPSATQGDDAFAKEVARMEGVILK